MICIDPIVEEVRKVRDAHAKQFNYDLKAIYSDLKQREQGSGRRYVSLAPRRLVNEIAGSAPSRS